MRGLSGVDNLPIVFVKHRPLVIRKAALRVVQDQARTQRREGGIDMDRVGIAWKINRMDPVIGEMAAQPFDAFEVCREPVLHDQIAAKAQHISGVKQWLFFGGHKELFSSPLQALFDPDFVAEIVRVVILVCQPRFGRAFVAEVRVLVEITLHQGAVIEIFKPAAAIGHRGLQHLRAHRQQHVTRRHTAKLAVRVEIGRGHGLRMVDGVGPVHPHAARL